MAVVKALIGRPPSDFGLGKISTLMNGGSMKTLMTDTSPGAQYLQDGGSPFVSEGVMLARLDVPDGVTIWVKVGPDAVASATYGDSVEMIGGSEEFELVNGDRISLFDPS